VCLELMVKSLLCIELDESTGLKLSCVKSLSKLFTADKPIKYKFWPISNTVYAYITHTASSNPIIAKKIANGTNVNTPMNKPAPNIL